MNFTAIILAGGRSRRMGANKALMAFRGKPLIQFSIDLALQFTNRILIVSNSHELDSIGFPVIGDRFPIKAPLVGIHAGLEVSETPWNLVLTCDMPNVSKGLIELLIAGLPHADKLLVPTHDGFVEPLCGFYHRDLLQQIAANIESGRLSPLDMITDISNRVMSVGDLAGETPAYVFKNVNSTNDLV
ncbi:MAG: molybdenum cofactor guanylyltransferase [Bacteroidetes bacterium]|nr:molybdenum cofactor guanylyltransferase [Bacteroidota bacterium]